MQIQPEKNQQQIPTYNFNPNPTYSRFIFFLGMAVFAVISVGILTAISNQVNPIANSIPEKIEDIPTEKPEPQAIIVNVPKPALPDNHLGLSLDEYSNLSDPSDEMLTCLKNEGGKGCFESEYRPNIPEPYYQQLHSNYQAVRVYNRQIIDNWYPSTMPPIPQGACDRFYMVKFGNRLYCGRRLIGN